MRDDLSSLMYRWASASTRIVVLLMGTACGLAAQDWKNSSSLSTSAGVRIVAIMRGTVTVSVRRVPIAFDFDPNGPNNKLSIPITTSWNVSPHEVHEVELIGYFEDPAHALIDVNGNSISSCYVLGFIEQESPRRFEESNLVGPPGGSLRLFSQAISHSNSRANRHDLLQLQLDAPNLTSVPSSRYTSVLHLEARYF